MIHINVNFSTTYGIKSATETSRSLFSVRNKLNSYVIATS